MEFVRFYAFILKIGLLLAMAGQLKACTLVMLHKAAEQPEIMSYSKYSRMLTMKTKLHGQL